MVIIGTTVAVAVLLLARTGCPIVVTVSRSNSVSNPTTVADVQHVPHCYTTELSPWSSMVMIGIAAVVVVLPFTTAGCSMVAAVSRFAGVPVFHPMIDTGV